MYFVRLEKALMRGKNEREIPLAPYIRLEYNYLQKHQLRVYKDGESLYNRDFVYCALLNF